MFRALAAIDPSFAGAALRPFTGLELFLAERWGITVA
jgi:hypothetical protein